MKKIIVVGAGPAGLTTAYELLKKSREYVVIILEKSDRLGGISSSITFEGNKIDTGIHRFFSKDDRVNKIWEELLPIQGKESYDDKILSKNKIYSKSGPDPEKEDKVMLVKDRVTRIYYNKKFFDYPIQLNIKTMKNLGIISLILIVSSYIKSLIFKRKEKNLEDLYINKFGKKLYQIFFETYTEKVWGRHPRDISSDWGNQRVKGISIKEIMKDIIRKIFHKKNIDNTETSLIETFTYPKLGCIQMWEEMAKEIQKMGGIIKYNVEVTNIKIVKNKVVSISYKEKEKVIKEEVNIIVSSMPIRDLFIALKGMKISKKIYNNALNLPYREFMSVGLLLDKMKLKNQTRIKTINNVLPDSWIYIQDSNVKMGRIQIFNNWSPYLFNNKKDIHDKILISLEYFVTEGDYYWNMSDKDFIEFAIQEAEKIHLLNRENVLSSVRIKISKAYPGYFDSYSEFDKIKETLNKINNLYCIGRNGQHRYNNMDHSMLTGIETADSILNNNLNKQKIWNVNTEDEYHEIKSKTK